MIASVTIAAPDEIQYFLQDTNLIVQKMCNGEATDIYAGFGEANLSPDDINSFFRITAKNNSQPPIDFKSISNCSVDIVGVNFSWHLPGSEIALKFSSLIIESKKLIIKP